MHGIRKDASSTGPLHGGVTIGRLMAGVDYSRPLRPKWSGTAGISFQVSSRYFFPPIPVCVYFKLSSYERNVRLLS